MFKKVIKWIENIIIAFLVVFIILFLISLIQSKSNPTHIPSVLGFKTMSVLTGSMRPVLYPGDMIIVKETNPESIKENDIITYRKGLSTLVTHRVVEVVNRDGMLMFRTKGDANNTEDDSLVPSDNVIGSMVFKIPYGGYVSKFVRSPVGFAFFVIIPLILLIGGEIRAISRKNAEIKREELKKRVIGK